MARKLALLLALIFAGACLAAGKTASGKLQVEKLVIRKIYDQTGALSEPITKDSNLWNQSVGENASNSLFIDVVVSGPPTGFFTGEPQVDLTAVTEHHSGKLTSRQSAAIHGSTMRGGKLHVAFIEHGTGAYPLTISANVRGDRKIVTVRLPFDGGE